MMQFRKPSFIIVLTSKVGKDEYKVVRDDHRGFVTVFTGTEAECTEWVAARTIRPSN